MSVDHNVRATMEPTPTPTSDVIASPKTGRRNAGVSYERPRKTTTERDGALMQHTLCKAGVHGCRRNCCGGGEVFLISTEARGAGQYLQSSIAY